MLLVISYPATLNVSNLFHFTVYRPNLLTHHGMASEGENCSTCSPLQFVATCFSLEQTHFEGSVHTTFNSTAARQNGTRFENLQTD